MLDFLWSLFDLLVIILFVYFFLKVTRLGLAQIKPKWRLVAIPVLLVGVISFLNNPKESEEETKIIGVDYQVDYFTVPVSLINNLSVSVVRKKSDGIINPALSDSFFTGFILGRKWRQDSVKETSAGIEIQGHVNYYLIGWNFMSFHRSILIESDPEQERINFKHEYSS